MFTVNELKINQLLSSSKLPEKFIESLSRRKSSLEEPHKSLKPKYVVKPLAWNKASRMILDIFKRLNLLEEVDKTKRLFTFIGYCKYRNYSLTTTKKYFNEAKRLGVFGSDIPVIPDSLFFNKSVHNRLIGDEVFSKFIRHLQKNWGAYNAPLLTAFYTGLRSTELLQLDTKILQQLCEKKTFVDIIRKDTRKKKSLATQNQQTNQWKPVYFDNFNKFIESLKVLYADKYICYVKHGLNSTLFDVSGPSTLVYRMHIEFYKANGFFPPKGFGIHMFRNQIARKLASTHKNLHIIKNWLGHKHIKTTKVYINEYYNNIGKEFDKMTEKHYDSIKQLLSF